MRPSPDRSGDDLFILRDVSGHIRLDSGAECIAKAVRDRIGAVGAKTASIAPEGRRENEDCESFNAKLRDALLDGESFDTPAEAKVVIESWRRHDNTRGPH